MKHLIFVLTFSLIPIFVKGILNFMRQPKQAEKGQVYLPKSVVIIGTIFFVVFLIPTMITVFLDEPWWTPMIFFVMALSGAALIIGFVNCRISYDEEGFVAKNFWGIKRHFTYDQVTAIKENLQECYIYMDNRKVMIEELAIGKNEFIRMVKKKYKTIHDGEKLPQARNDIFKGNVNDVSGILLTYILPGVLMVGSLGLSIHHAYFTPNTVSNTIKQSVSFVSCNVDDEEIILESEDKQTYVIDEHFNSRGIQSICNGDTVVTTYSTKVTPDDAEPYYSIKAISHNGTYLLSFEETNKLHRQEYTLIVIFVAALCLVWGAAFACIIIIGRNPRKFSLRVVLFFFKSGTIKY